MTENIEHSIDYEIKMKEDKEKKALEEKNKKDKYVQQYRNNYNKYKEKIKETRLNNVKKWTCECNKTIDEKRKDVHLKTKLHKLRMRDLHKEKE